MSTTRFTNGITTSAKSTTTGFMGTIDPSKLHVWFDDFDKYTAADWAVNGTGTSSEAVQNEDGGVFKTTNATADNDSSFLQWGKETFKLESGKKLWFKSRVKVSDATQSDFVIGLQITDTSPLDVSDGVFFLKDDGDANLDFHVEKNGTQTSSTALHTVVNDTWMILGFYYNGVDSVAVFVDDVMVDRLAVTNLPDDEELTISFGIQNGEAAAKSMSVDYILVAKER